MGGRPGSLPVTPSLQRQEAGGSSVVSWGSSCARVQGKLARAEGESGVK